MKKERLLILFVFIFLINIITISAPGNACIDDSSCFQEELCINNICILPECINSYECNVNEECIDYQCFPLPETISQDQCDISCGANEICINNQCAKLFFYDYFLTDPNTNGKWDIYKNDAQVGKLDNTYGPAFLLTPVVNNLAIAMFAKSSLSSITSKKWRAEFNFSSYKSGTDAQGDGIVFLFYKNQEPYRTGAPAYGGSLGFVTITVPVVKGYGVEFDSYYNSLHDDPFDNGTSIIKDTAGESPGSHLAYVEDYKAKDDKTHHVIVEFDNGHVSVNLDRNDSDEIYYEISDINYSYLGFGFSASTGDLNSEQRIKNITLYCYLKTCSDYPDKCGSFDDGCGGTLDCTNVCKADETCTSGVCVSNNIFSVKFIPPTHDDRVCINSSYVEVKTEITNTSRLDFFKFNWNNVNYSIYDDSLVLMMNFDDYTRKNDTSKYANHGTCTSSYCPQFTSNGKYGGAYDFDGNYDYISIRNSQSLNPKKITASAWFKTSDTGASNNILAKLNECITPYSGYAIWINENGIGSGRISFYIGNWYAGGGWLDAPASIRVNDNKWHYVAGTYNGSMIAIYVDGILVNNKSIGSQSLYSSNPLYIGKLGSNCGSPLDGLIDEVRIWNRSLSKEEVYENYISNLQKYNQSQWYFYVNQSKNITAGLDNGTYNYQAFVKSGTTEKRTIKIGNCVSSGVGWFDMDGNSIGSNKNSNIPRAERGDSVFLIWRNTGLEPESIVQFDIYEADNGKFDLTNPDDHITIVESMVNSNGDAIAEWTITNEDFEIGTEIGELYDGNEEFYFESDGEISDYLIVNKSVNNKRPVISIIKPEKESVFIIKNNGRTNDINFNQINSNTDDNIKIIWDFGDGTGDIFDNCKNPWGNCNTTHQYNSSGTKIVKAIVNEMTRLGKAEDRSRIYIYKEGLNLFSIIDSPDYKFPLLKAGIYLINGTSSHVANCSYSLSRCQTSSSNCYEKVDSIDPSLKIYCYKIATSDQLNFNWTIDNKEYKNNTDSRPFNVAFISLAEHVINLKNIYSF